MTDNEIYEAYECCITGGAMTMSSALRCGECPYFHRKRCVSELKVEVLGLLHRQQAEIERLEKENKILSENADTAFQDGLNEAQDLYAEQVKNKVRAEAIKEFADSFDDELAKLRDTYFESGRIEYGLVCEVIHGYLYRTLREMVGDKNG